MATTTTVQTRLADYLNSIYDVADLDALPLLYGDGYGQHVIRPLHEQLEAMTLGAIRHINNGDEAMPPLGLITRVSAIIMRSIALGYQFRESEYQRAIEREEV